MALTTIHGSILPSIDDTPIGGTTPSTGAFTTLGATGTITGASGTWSATGIDLATTDSYFIATNNVLSQTALGSTVLASSLTSLGTITSLVATTADINGGTVDATNIGATTAGTGAFTTIVATDDVLLSGDAKGLGYATGSGGAVTQITNRTTGVTLNKSNGGITLISAAGSTSWQTLTVTNSVVVATDTIILNQQSGTDLNLLHVTAIGAGSFDITFATTAGTTTEQPVFNFSVIKSVAA